MSGKIDHYIGELLYDHDCVIISDLGGFIAHYKGAAINPALHVIAPPSRKIAFNSSLRHNDGLLASYISRQGALTYIDACDVIREYVNQAMRQMKNGQKLKIEKIGVLFIDKEQNLQFLPDQGANFLIESFGMSPVHAPAIRRPDTYHEPERIKLTGERRKRSWKILEVIPAAAVLAFLFMMPPVLDNINTNLGTMLPFSRINEYIDEWKGEKTSKSPVVHYPSPFETPAVTISEPDAAPVAPLTVPDTPAIPVTEPVAEETMKTVVPDEKEKITAANNEKLWHVVGGAFRKEKNAEVYVSQLREKGVMASIIGQNDAGFYLVSIFNSPAYSQALDTLPALKSNVISGAWIFRK